MSIEAIFAILILLVLLGFGAWMGFYFMDRRATIRHDFETIFKITYTPYKEADGTACNAVFDRLLALARVSSIPKRSVRDAETELAKWLYDRAEKCALKAGYKDQVREVWAQMAKAVEETAKANAKR